MDTFETDTCSAQRVFSLIASTASIGAAAASIGAAASITGASIAWTSGVEATLLRR
jgi:hypothetical protein